MLGLIDIWWEIPSHFIFVLIATFGVPFIRGKIKIQYKTKTSTVGSTKDCCKEARVHFNLAMERIKHRRSCEIFPFTWYDMKLHMETTFAVNLSLREFLYVTISSNQFNCQHFSSAEYDIILNLFLVFATKGPRGDVLFIRHFCSKLKKHLHVSETEHNIRLLQISFRSSQEEIFFANKP